MTEHYYTAEPVSGHDERRFTEVILGNALSFVTDAGVFSRDGLDRGTEVLLDALPELSGRVLDLGCGWGAIGVTLALRYPEAQLVMSDVNERAVGLARRNLALNGARGEVVVSDGFAGLEGTFDHVVTNPPIRAGKQVIYGLFDGARERLRSGGSLNVVIRKQQGAPSALKHLQERFGQADVVGRGGGYWIIRAVKSEM